MIRPLGVRRSPNATTTTDVILICRSVCSDRRCRAEHRVQHALLAHGVPLALVSRLPMSDVGERRRSVPDDEVVRTSDLASLVPGLMARHGECVWMLASGRTPAEDLVIELHPIAHPDRVATVRVFAGAEVFSFAFAGHESTDFAYTDADRPDTLRERIDLAVAAAVGPTRVVCDTVGGIVVRSTLIFDHGGSHPRPDGVVSYPFRRLKAWFRGDRSTRQVHDFPAA